MGERETEPPDPPLSAGAEMARRWDERARQDALFFIDTRRAFGSDDLGGFWESGEHDLEAVLSRVGTSIGPQDVVLDIGCGVGRITRAVARRARRAYGIDVSGEMIARARALNGELANVEWIHGDGVSLRPLSDASIDACVSHVVFQHIPQPDVTLGYVREMGRVLRDGGWAAFVLSTDPEVHRPAPPAGLRERIRRLRGLAPPRPSDPAWLGAAVTGAALRATAAESGLRLERVLDEGTQFCEVLARREPR
jgi:SAM-dependent methyltransferase